ncbi:hypothetical protein I79_023772 [Cricetulus griseus]|uniref:Uncharacterized protein n=1 Tax=Cricetulus griseus TaxID=10029 RepID=G3IIU5_CRIGR|nr:hypothetical protein I79_023772 [Cricetulus griseus]
MWGYVQEQKKLKDSCVTKVYPTWMTAHKAGKLEHTAQLAQGVVECPLQVPQLV